MGSSVCPPDATFLLDDNLCQHRMGQVVAGFGIKHNEVALGADHLSQVVESDVGAGLGVVESPVRVFLDDDRIFLVRGRVRLVEHDWGRFFPTCHWEQYHAMAGEGTSVYLRIRCPHQGLIATERLPGRSLPWYRPYNRRVALELQHHSRWERSTGPSATANEDRA